MSELQFALDTDRISMSELVASLLVIGHFALATFSSS